VAWKRIFFIEVNKEFMQSDRILVEPKVTLERIFNEANQEWLQFEGIPVKLGITCGNNIEEIS